MRLKTMRVKTMGLLFALVCGSMISVVQAHHSPFNFDMAKEVDVKGTLLSVDFVNPHSQFRLEGKDASGKPVVWAFESQPPAWFSKAGIKKSDFGKGIGQQVTISANVAKDGTPFGLLRKMTFTDGSSVAWLVGAN